MKKSEREKQWMACLDGQMTAGEAAAFDESLSEDERQRLSAEMRLEQRIGESLREEVRCPDALWAKVRAEMEQPAASAGHVVLWRRPLYLALAAAASVLLVLSAGMYTMNLEPAGQSYPGPDGRPVLVQSIGEEIQTSADLAARSLVPAEKALIENFLSEHDIKLAVNQNPESVMRAGGKAKLLGACMGNCPKGSIVEVLIDCDGTPAKLVVARSDGHGARIIEAARHRGEVMQTRSIGEYLAGVVCRDRAGTDNAKMEMLLDFLDELPKPVADEEPFVTQRDTTPRTLWAGHQRLSTVQARTAFT